MQRMWSWLGLNLGKHAGVVSVVGLLVTLILGFGATRLDFATGQDSYLNKDEVVYKDNVKYQGLFGGEAMLTLYTMDDGKQVKDLFTPENLSRLRAQEKRLRATTGVLDVVSPITALQFTDNLVASKTGNPADSVAGKILLEAATREKDPAKAQIRTQDNFTTLTRINAVKGPKTLENPQWVDFLLHDNQGKIRKSLLPFFPDEGHAQMVSRLIGNASLEDEGKAAEAVVKLTDQPMANASVTTTGAAELLKQLNDYLRGGMLLLGAIAIAIMVLILLLLFDVRWRLLPLAVILVGVVWAFGLAGYLGIPLSVVTIAGLPVMLGVGIDYAIQMHSRIEEEVVIARATHPIQEAARGLGPALLVVTFDAIFAFLALRFAQVPMIRAFGLLLAVGIAAICLCSIIMPLSILGIREYRSPTKGHDFSTGKLGRLVVWLGSLPARLGVWLALAALVIFAGGMAVEGKLTLQTDPERWVNQSSNVIHKIDTLDKETGSSSEIGIFVQSKHPFDDETVGYVDHFARQQLAERPKQLLTASSVVTTVSFLLDIPGASTLAPTGDNVAAAYGVAPKDIQMATANTDKGALNLIFRTASGPLEDRAVYIDEIRDQIDPPPGVSATPSGLAVVGVGLLHNIEDNRILLTYLAIAFVAVFLAFRLRSIVRSLLSLVPVLIAVGTASLAAWALGLKLSPMTAVGGPLVVAACTEFTSLILLRYLEERRRGREPREAVDITASHTGRAFIVSACTAIAGVAVIACSSLPLLRDFGIVVALNVTVALLSALVVLPPLLVWADQHGWVSRGIVDKTGRDPRDMSRDAALQR